MRRRGLEPPPTKCGPGPQPCNPGVRSVRASSVQIVHGSGQNGRNGRSGCCHRCCRVPIRVCGRSRRAATPRLTDLERTPVTARGPGSAGALSPRHDPPWSGAAVLGVVCLRAGRPQASRARRRRRAAAIRRGTGSRQPRRPPVIDDGEVRGPGALGGDEREAAVGREPVVAGRRVAGDVDECGR